VAIRPDGSDSRVLIGTGGGAEGAIWSPDGTSIAFNGDQHTVNIFELENETTRTLAKGVELGGWSPDGSQIAVSVLDAELSGYAEGIWVFSEAGRSGRILSEAGLMLVDVFTGDTDIVATASYIDSYFHPNGDSLVFHWRTSELGGEVLRINRDGSGLEKLTSGSSPRVSPDGCKISFDAAPRLGSIGVMNSDGTMDGRWGDGTGSSDDQGAVWSPDALSYAFSRFDPISSRFEVWIKDLTTDTALELVPTGIEGRVTDWGIAPMGYGQKATLPTSETGESVTQGTRCMDTGNASRATPIRSLEYWPRGLVNDGLSIWAANSSNGTVSKLRVSDGILEEIFPVGEGPDHLAFDGTNIWVANEFAGTVTKLRASDGLYQDTIRVGIGLDIGAIAFDGANIWVSNSGDGTVTKLRASDGTLEGVFATGAWPGDLAFDGAYIWVSNSGDGTVTKLRASDGEVAATYFVGAFDAWRSGLVFDGANIWVSNSGDGTVTKLRASDGTLEGVFATGGQPGEILFDGTNIWVENGGDGSESAGTISKLRATDGAILGTYAVGIWPWGLVFDGANIWVSNGWDNTVSKLRAADGVLLDTYTVTGGS